WKRPIPKLVGCNQQLTWPPASKLAQARSARQFQAQPNFWNSHPTKRAELLPPVIMRVPLTCILFACLCSLSVPSRAQDWHLPLPKKSDYTPVQQLNRDGVKALQKHDMNKAKTLFYKAYLIDPDDPFTLNNLGYVAELEGELDRAQRY